MVVSDSCGNANLLANIRANKTMEVDRQKNSRAVVVEWINHILNRKKWRGTDLARHSGLAPSTILRLLNDPRHRFIPSLKTLQKIADGSGSPIPRKVTEALGAARIEPTAEPEAINGAGTMKARATRDLPKRKATVEVRPVSSLPSALQAASRHRSAHQEVTVPIPPQLDGDDTAFAFYAPDNTMDPYIKVGTLMYASKRRDPLAGDFILVSDRNGRSRVRLLIDINEKGLHMTKSSPASGSDEVMPFDDIEDLAIVAVIVKI
jgi:transcriptional regulator with XRE-family HTH domain